MEPNSSLEPSQNRQHDGLLARFHGDFLAYFLGSIAIFAALWAYLALSPDEKNFFLRGFLRFEIPPSRVNHQGTELFYSIGYAAILMWIGIVAWTSAVKTSLIKGFFVGSGITILSVSVVSGAAAFLGGATELFQDSYRSNGRSVFNVIFMTLGWIVGIGLVGAVLMLIGGHLGPPRD